MKPELYIAVSHLADSYCLLPDRYPVDLNERNCMWGMAPLQHLSRSAKYKALGRPLKQTIPSVKLWKRGELIRPMEVPESLRTDDFYLGDFGLVMKVGDPVAQSGYPPMQFCSPERFHGIYPSFACDMWSYMINFPSLPWAATVQSLV